MGEKEYVAKVLKYAESSFSYIVGMLSILVAWVIFKASSLSTTWLIISIVLGVIYVLGLLVCAQILRRFLRKLREL